MKKRTSEDAVLSHLRDHRDRFFSGEELSRKLGVSRTAVWKEIRSLRALGYKIEARSHEGYRLAAIPDKLFADEIRHGLKTRQIGRQIVSYEETDSTNDAVFQLGEQGVEEGVCVLAEHQRQGRGRMGRRWTAPKGESVLLSVLLRPRLAPSDLPKITLSAAVSTARAVRELTGQTPGIKWPNDLLYKEKKFCGILTEMSAETDRVNFIVLGIGVNVNSAASALPPGSTSLSEIAGKTVSRVDLTRRLLEHLEKDYQRLKDGRFAELVEEWEHFSVTTGRRVEAKLLDRVIHGQASGIDSDGALWIRKDSGLQERILSGDIKHLRPSS